MDKQNHMYLLVEEWKSSTMTKGEFSATKSVTYHSFNYWVQKYNQEYTPKELNSEVSFFSVPDKIGENKKEFQTKRTDCKAVLIELPNGVKISIYQ
jgi:hypothetical protein